MAKTAKSPSLMMVVSKFIRIFAVVKAFCQHWQSAATLILRIKKETLSSFRDIDKTAKLYLKTPGEQKSNRSYLYIKVRAFCYTVGCLGSWRYLSKSQKQEVSVPFFI